MECSEKLNVGVIVTSYFEKSLVEILTARVL